MVPAVVFKVHVPPFRQAGLQAEVLDALGAVADVLEATTPEATRSPDYKSHACFVYAKYHYVNS